ncbi:MAG: M48 family metalloprotease [Saprospiraceae bacterium]|nr:M48 family metalloprotease [Saprospiraceae bacterium]
MGSKLIIFLAIILATLSSCNKEYHNDETYEGQQGLTVTDDRNIGRYIDQYIMAKADTCPSLFILDNEKYSALYAYLYEQRDKIISSGILFSQEDWSWTIRVFDETDVEHAFVAPGGYIYLSRNLLLELNSEAELIAILGQAMINIDSRYVSTKLENTHSFNQLTEISLGGSTENISSLLTEIKEVPYDLSTVETIDIYVQDLMCSIDYNIQHYSTFVLNSSNETEWIQLYPNYDNRAEVLNNQTNTNACLGQQGGQEPYDQIKALIQ